MSSVKTSKVENRRTLRFARLADLVADVEALGDRVRATGNWSPAQVVDHVATVIECAIDGFPVPNASIFIRGIMKIGFMRSRSLNVPMPAGLKFPKKFDFLEPASDLTWEDATTRLRKTIGRIDSGERMVQRSPVFGFLEHEEWIQLHCRHGEMHFSFLHPEGDESPDAGSDS